LASIARQASSITKDSNSAARASSAEKARKSAGEHAFDAECVEERCKPRGRLAVRLDESGIGIDARGHALAPGVFGANPPSTTPQALSVVIMPQEGVACDRLGRNGARAGKEGREKVLSRRIFRRIVMMLCSG
jgi:hypothetical protein